MSIFRIILFIFCMAVPVTITFVALRIAPNTAKKPYTAVFLDNDQVYFGQIVSEGVERLELQNVYYLRASILKQATNSAEVSLLKRGDELHAPKDKMMFNLDHILFYEEMRNDGIIMNAISEHAQR